MSITGSRSLSFLKVSIFVTCGMAVVCSSSAQADGSSLPYGRGGMRFNQMDSIVAQYNHTGELFRIEGECRSSCTELLAIRKLCIDPSATLKFHAALQSPTQTVSPARNMQMASHYNSRLSSFVLANHYMDSWEFHSISGSDMIHKFGYRQCPAK
jgi:hypothetical protein